MNLRLRDGLPFVTAVIAYQGRQIQLENVLLDTGSAGTIFAVDRVLTIGLQIEPRDEVHRIRGVGGSEFVFQKIVDKLRAGPLKVQSFAIQVRAMDYGIPVDGILGVDFLHKAGAIVDLAALQLRPSRRLV
jgi:hypothetical protein